MEIDRAIEIVQSLADGVDPYTAEQLPADGPYQRADTVRALYKLLDTIKSGTKTPKPLDPNKPHAGGKWTPEEEQNLRDAFHASKTFSEIAKDHGRTPGAIKARLVKLGLIEDTPPNRPGQGNTPPPNPSPTTITPDDCPF